MYFEKNIQALSRDDFHRQVAAQLRQVSPTDEVVLEQTQSGDYTLLYRSVYLHDLKGAEAEAKTICSNQCRAGQRSHHFIFGLGLGYLLQEVYRHSPGQVYIYESDLPFLRFILDNVDLSEFFASPRVRLCITPQLLIQRAHEVYSYGDQVDVLFLEGYAKLWGDELMRLVKEDLGGLLLEKRNSVLTTFAYHLDWNKMFYRNVPYFAACYPFSTLKDRFSGKPALVISSGPSLEKYMDDVKAIADRVVTVAVGGALRPLLAAGIRPDFAAFTDYQGPEKQLFGLENQMSETSLILGPFVNPICHETNAKYRFLPFFSNYPDFSEWIARQIGENKPSFLSGGTVSMTAIQSALAMGCDPIIVIGQDLAVAGEQVYAGGGKGRIDQDGCLVLEDTETQLGQRYKLLDVPGQNGGTVKTTQDYAQYIGDIAELARRHRLEKPDTQFFNASVGGAYIDGFEHIPLQLLINQLSSASLDKSLSLGDSIGSALDDSEQAKKKRIQSAMRMLVQSTETCLGLGKQAREPLEPLVQGIFQQGTVDHYKRFSHAHSEFTKRIFAHPLLSYALHREIWVLYRNANADCENESQAIETFKHDLEFYNASLSTLETLLPCMKDALTRVSD